MNYTERKRKLIEMREKLLQDYNILLAEVIKYGESTIDYDSEEIESIDEEEKKARRILAALLYTEYPDDIEVRDALRKLVFTATTKNK